MTPNQMLDDLLALTLEQFYAQEGPCAGDVNFIVTLETQRDRIVDLSQEQLDKLRTTWKRYCK